MPYAGLGVRALPRRPVASDTAMTTEAPPADANPDSPPSASPAGGGRGALSWAWRVASVRLRFLLVLGAVALIVAEWEWLRNVWDKVSRGATGEGLASQSVSADTEYFCPMDPGVLSDWPSKCPICNMGLVRRKKGDATPLPEGVIARMQFSPYRMQLAGIQVVPVGYRALVREAEGPGRVVSAASGDSPAAGVELDLFASDAGEVAEGREALVLGPAPEPLKGAVHSLDARPEAGLVVARLEVADPAHSLRQGMAVRGRVFVPIASVEPFRSMPSEPPALRKGEPRKLYICHDHSEVVREKPERCPRDQNPLMAHPLAANQRVVWWCPMHPSVTASEPGRECKECGGMVLVPRVVSYNPPGEVLAVPEGAVIDTGKRTVVYLEKMAGMFDGVEVVLGPRCGDAYPVVRGLEPGQRVVTAGAFLVDAETRLNPSVAASYFGAARREEAVAPALPDDAPSPADQEAIARQKICPVTGKPLGSMGAPMRLEVEGRTVYLCCEGCEGRMRKEPAKYFAKIPSGPAGSSSDPKRSP
jgi:membrane fusion protein, copper/silver efflux system